MSRDVSIEYAHIYTNNKIAEEHAVSLKVLNEVKNELDDQSISLVVLVDDYSFPDPTFNYREFSDWLDEYGFKPDILFRESQLIPVCDELLELVEDKTLKEEIVDYIKAKKYPCSLFIASWYLVRLGHLQLQGYPSELVASRLVNILPSSFKPFEDKGLEIIGATKFATVVNQIQYKFFQGRLIA